MQLDFHMVPALWPEIIIHIHFYKLSWNVFSEFLDWMLEYLFPYSRHTVLVHDFKGWVHLTDQFFIYLAPLMLIIVNVCTIHSLRPVHEMSCVHGSFDAARFRQVKELIVPHVVGDIAPINSIRFIIFYVLYRSLIFQTNIEYFVFAHYLLGLYPFF